MTDQQLIDSVRSLCNAVLTAGLIKKLDDASGLLNLVHTLEGRLLSGAQPAPSQLQAK